MAHGRRAKPSKQDLLAHRKAIWPDDGCCPLCGRPMQLGASTNEHHLVPRMYGGTLKYVLHRVCHSKIHSLFSEADLAYVYNTFESLRENPEIKSFVKWVRKQDPDFNTKHRRPN